MLRRHSNGPRPLEEAKEFVGVFTRTDRSVAALQGKDKARDDVLIRR